GRLRGARRQRPHLHPRHATRGLRAGEEGGAAGHGRQVRTVERAGPPRADPADAQRCRPGRRAARPAAMTAGGHGAAPRAGHLPVLYDEVMEGLAVRSDGTYLDGTFGRGGHARGVLQELGPGGRLLLMDKDPEAIATAEREFSGDPRVAIRRGSFADLAAWDATAGGLDGVLLDLGVSSPQLDVAERGFSFGKDGPLDMRMDPDAGESAAHWLARADEQEIADVLWRYGEERQSRRIARAIVAARAQAPIERTAQLAEAGVAPTMTHGKTCRDRNPTHQGTRRCKGSRIFINLELAGLEAGTAAAMERLTAGGRLMVISFHSLEDRKVKQFIAECAKAPPTDRR